MMTHTQGCFKCSMTLCSLVDGYWCFGGVYCLHLHFTRLRHYVPSKCWYPSTSLHGILTQNATRSYQKVPRLGQKRNTGLTYSVLAAISYKIVSLGMHTVILSFFPHFISTMEVIFHNAVEYHLQFPLDVRHCFKMSLQFHFQFGKQIQLLSPVMILEIKVGSSLASLIAQNMFTHHCF
jgi:hypothetical protein